MLSPGRNARGRATFERHRPEKTLLYQLVEAHFTCVGRPTGPAGQIPAHLCSQGFRSLPQVRPPRTRIPAGALRHRPFITLLSSNTVHNSLKFRDISLMLCLRLSNRSSHVPSLIAVQTAVLLSYRQSRYRQIEGYPPGRIMGRLTTTKVEHSKPGEKDKMLTDGGVTYL